MTAEQIQLLNFLSGIGLDNRGRSISDIWSMSMDELEYTHDYIQWIFPTNQKSKANKDSVVLTKEMIDFIKVSPEIQNNIITSFILMTKFYGFDYNEYDKTLKVEIPTNEMKWISPLNHNFLRITRIIKSLRLCGREDLAERFYTAVDDVTYNHRYCDISRKYWKKALNK